MGSQVENGKEVEVKVSEVENGSEVKVPKKPKVLCFHAFRTSGAIFKKQVYRWPEAVTKNLDLVFLDGPFPAQGKSDVEGIFEGPYFEWFQYSKYQNFDECVKYVEDYMVEHGPFDGFLGFSLGATLAAGLLGLQDRGVALTKVPKLKFAILISAAMVRHPPAAEKAYAAPIAQPTLHFLGDNDYVKPYGLKLLEHCVDPVVINHPKGHMVPRIRNDPFVPLLPYLISIFLPSPTACRRHHRLKNTTLLAEEHDVQEAWGGRSEERDSSGRGTNLSFISGGGGGHGSVGFNSSPMAAAAIEALGRTKKKGVMMMIVK
ncbi:dihydrofolate reductase [Senna tora]|uniref:Dihydrofolate reductase n=1 Tax=Senna tora TaxID=362788 RepID=A0A834TWK9_9FABA|nr:dihydrofolate reductase [Senna tora]